jgi:hypothetical protein
VHAFYKRVFLEILTFGCDSVGGDCADGVVEHSKILVTVPKPTAFSRYVVQGGECEWNHYGGTPSTFLLQLTQTGPLPPLS